MSKSVREGKVEQALNEKSKTYERKNYKPGAWAGVLMMLLLKDWEDRHRMTEVAALLRAKISKVMSVTALPSFGKWRKLRRELPKHLSGGLDTWDTADYTLDADAAEQVENLFLKFQMTEIQDMAKKERAGFVGEENADNPVLFSEDQMVIPTIMSWLRTKRVFVPSKKMFESFLALDMSKAPWEDVLMPFEAFVVELPEGIPITLSENVTSHVEAVVVQNVEVNGVKKIWLFPLLAQTKGVAQENYSESARGILDEARNGNKQLLRARDLMLGATKSFMDGVRHPGATLQSGFTFGAPIELSETIETEDEGGRDNWNVLKKAVAGVCLYLSSKSGAKKFEQHQAEQQTPTSGGVFIENVDDVFVLEGSEQDGEDETIQKELASELKRRKSPEPHDRRAHYYHYRDRKTGEVHLKKRSGSRVGKLAEGAVTAGTTTKVD